MDTYIDTKIHRYIKQDTQHLPLACLYMHTDTQHINIQSITYSYKCHRMVSTEVLGCLKAAGPGALAWEPSTWEAEAGGL